jgi:predicted phosphodiesterase
MRILILSDIHSNLPALETVLQSARKQGYDRVWCLGDIVGYGPDPNECVAQVERLGAVSIAGNHDWGALGRISLDDFNPDAQRASLWTRDELTPEMVAYLDECPELWVEGDFTLAHGSPRHPIWEYIQLPSVAAANFHHFDTPYCLVGHTHVPVVYTALEGHGADIAFPSLESPLALTRDRMIINPGSVGQPRDGDPRASYAILDQAKATIEFYRVDYPIDRVQAKIMGRGLPRRLAARLALGW